MRRGYQQAIFWERPSSMASSLLPWTKTPLFILKKWQETHLLSLALEEGEKRQRLIL